MSIKMKVFYEKSMTKVDNYFVTDALIIYWAGDAGIGIIGTNTRNRLPKDIKPFYQQK